ncbi:MAG: hypothetical protein ACREF5_01830 [Candidatus Saccharimonadales bacterium]
MSTWQKRPIQPSPARFNIEQIHKHLGSDVQLRTILKNRDIQSAKEDSEYFLTYQRRFLRHTHDDLLGALVHRGREIRLAALAERVCEHGYTGPAKDDRVDLGLSEDFWEDIPSLTPDQLIAEAARVAKDISTDNFILPEFGPTA